MSSLRNDLRKHKNKTMVENAANTVVNKINKAKYKINRVNKKIQKRLEVIEEAKTIKRAEKQKQINFENSIKLAIKTLLDQYPLLKDNYLLTEDIELFKENGCVFGKVNDFNFRTTDNGKLEFYLDPKIHFNQKADTGYNHILKSYRIDVKLLPFRKFTYKIHQLEDINILFTKNKVEDDSYMLSQIAYYAHKEKSASTYQRIDDKLNEYRNRKTNR